MSEKGKVLSMVKRARKSFVDYDDDTHRRIREAKLNQLAIGIKGLEERVSVLYALALEVLNMIPRINPPVPAYEPKERFPAFRPFSFGGMNRYDLLSQARKLREIWSQDEELLRQAWQQPTFLMWRRLESIDTIELAARDLVLVDKETGEKQVPRYLREMLDLERLWHWNEQNKEYLHGKFVGLLRDDASLYIRRQYKRQPRGDTSIVATNRILGPKINGVVTSYVCSVRRDADDGTRSIRTHAVYADTPVLPTTKAIYALFNIEPELNF
ncbi:MAG: hypothetical protein ACYC75_01420 [Minisyncoccota bacterium]